MRSIILFICLINCINNVGQSPYLINYQGVAHNELDEVISNSNIVIQVSI